MTPALTVCPETKLPLVPTPLAQAERQISNGAPLVSRAEGPTPVGPTPSVLVRADKRVAYPVAGGIPVLLVPEQLAAVSARREYDLTRPQYAEAYQEMGYYNEAAERDAPSIEKGSLADLERKSESIRRLAAVAETPAAHRSFLDPPAVWIEQGYESESIMDSYRHIAPVEGRRILQLGGRGHHAVKFLLAGARESVVISPMLEELAFARSLGNHYGVGERLHCVAAVAEELPFAAGTFDAIFSGGCLHHTVTSLSLPECVRVLRPGGKFAAVEPWRAPFYGMGIRIFGKSEPNAFCRPMTHARVEPLHAAFDSAQVIHHGATTRYPLKAFERMGLSLRPSLIARIGRYDDAISSRVPGLRSLGSSVALLGTVEG